jgi:hypothetical protein
VLKPRQPLFDPMYRIRFQAGPLDLGEGSRRSGGTAIALS